MIQLLKNERYLHAAEVPANILKIFRDNRNRFVGLPRFFENQDNGNLFCYVREKEGSHVISLNRKPREIERIITEEFKEESAPKWEQVSIDYDK